MKVSTRFRNARVSAEGRVGRAEPDVPDEPDLLGEVDILMVVVMVLILLLLLLLSLRLHPSMPSSVAVSRREHCTPLPLHYARSPQPIGGKLGRKLVFVCWQERT